MRWEEEDMKISEARRRISAQWRENRGILYILVHALLVRLRSDRQE